MTRDLQLDDMVRYRVLLPLSGNHITITNRDLSSTQIERGIKKGDSLYIRGIQKYVEVIDIWQEMPMIRDVPQDDPSLPTQLVNEDYGNW